MCVIRPYQIVVPTDIVSTTVPEVPISPWSSSFTYSSKGEIVSTGSGEYLWQVAHTTVESISGGETLTNTNKDPAGYPVIPAGYENAGSLWWSDVTGDEFAPNRYRMFSDNPAQATEHSGTITVVVRPSGTVWDALALFNVVADEISIEILSGPAFSFSTSIRFDDPISDDYQNRASVAFVDLPEVDSSFYKSAAIRVSLSVTVGRVLRVGTLVIGKKTEIGSCLYGTDISIMDFSRKERDTFGNVQLIERGYADTIDYKLEVRTDEVGPIKGFLASLRAVQAVYVGSQNLSETIVYGYYEDFLLTLEASTVSSATIKVASVVQGSPVESVLPVTVIALGDETICIVDGVPEGVLQFTVDCLLTEGDVVTWDITWLEGSSLNTFEVTSTNVSSVLEWPSGAVVTQAPAMGLVQASVQFADGDFQVAQPLKFSVRTCGCLASDLKAYWYNPATSEYDLTAVFGNVAFLEDLVSPCPECEPCADCVDCPDCEGSVDPPPEQPPQPPQPPPVDPTDAYDLALATTFDAAWYLSNNPDVAAAVADGTLPSAWWHYAVYGETEGRRPNPYFDPTYYRAQNPDVVAKLGIYFMCVHQHYQMFGYTEGRLPNAD
jgi:hypothetical protein